MDIQFPLTAILREPVAPRSVQTGETFQQALAQASAKDDKLADAAKQFEALMIGQVLKAARESSDGGWLGTGDDQTGSLALEMAEQSFAQGLAARGGLGIAKMVTAQLERGHSKAASSGSAPAEGPAPPSKDSTQ